MRYFWIYADQKNPQPQFNNWFKVVRPGRSSLTEVYHSLQHRNRFVIKMAPDVGFMDIISFPQFMVSREFADVIRMYDRTIRFRNLSLFEEKNHRTALYKLPALPELDCLTEDSELSRDKKDIIKGILRQEQIERYPIFQISQVSVRYVIANLELVESLYRRKIMGMKIQEFDVK